MTVCGERITLDRVFDEIFCETFIKWREVVCFVADITMNDIPIISVLSNKIFDSLNFVFLLRCLRFVFVVEWNYSMLNLSRKLLCFYQIEKFSFQEEALPLFHRFSVLSLSPFSYVRLAIIRK